MWFPKTHSGLQRECRARPSLRATKRSGRKRSTSPAVQRAPKATGPDFGVLHIEVALEEAGLIVETATSVGEALSLIDDLSQPLAALVTDIDLGEGPDGWEVAEHARELIPAIAVVYTSGAASDDWNARGVPGSVMLRKPVSPDLVAQTVQLLLAA